MELLAALGALTLFGSVVWFWIVTAILFVIFFASDINENGYLAFLTLVIVSFVYYFWGDIKLILPLFSLVNISIYLLIGFIYSTSRTFFSGRELGKEIKDLPLNDKDGHTYENQEYRKKEHMKELKGNVFRWWFMWPISLINWAVTDLIKDVWNFIFSKVKKFFNKILELGIKSA